ncbi:MAG: uroporphyrinogen-III C-methyltransferase [Chromatiales bacterium]|jgi:uroporphyrin-3 C-methyltransferase|nr:uroporphyrinogen-III C-methyltransferase [Chromatiales bacterium]
MSKGPDDNDYPGDDSVSRLMAPISERKKAQRKSAEGASTSTTQSAAGSANKSNDAAQENHGSRSGGGFATTLASVSLIVALGAVAVGYYVWRDTDARTTKALGDVEHRIESNTSTLGDALRGEMKALDQRLNTIQEAHSALSEEIRAALEAFNRPALTPVDIERLMLIANDAVTLQREPELALTALRMADKRLSALGDPAYAGVRRQLADEIATLENAPRPDIAGIAYGLAVMQKQLPSLQPHIGPKHMSMDANGVPQAAVADEASDPPRWRAVLSELWQTLRSMVVIRRTGAEESPLLAPEQQSALVQNIGLRLDSARMEALRGDQANFRIDVQQARDWLQQYYDAQQPVTAKLIARLNEFATVELQPALPDISGSLATLRGVMQKRVSAASAGSVAKSRSQAPAESAPPASNSAPTALTPPTSNVAPPAAAQTPASSSTQPQPAAPAQ